MSAPRFHIGFLDGLRGYAIAGVFTAHVCQAYGVALPRWLHFVGNGVTLFYVLSAYCLMMSLHRCDGSPRWGDYALRRYFRIAPAFYIAIVVWTSILLFGGRTVSISSILLSALFVNGWVPRYVHSAIPHGWSIGVETAFYALLPVLFVRLRNVRAAAVAFLVLTPLCVVVSWALPVLVGRLHTGGDLSIVSSYTMYWPPSQLPVFLLGILCYLIVAGRSQDGVAVCQALQGRPLAVSAGIVAIILGSGYLSGRVYHIGYAVAFAMLIVLLAGSPSRLFTNRFVTSLGTISYGTYLFHQCAIDATKSLIPIVDSTPKALAVIAVGAGLAICFGTLSYIFIEKPGIALGRRFSGWVYGSPTASSSG